MEKILLEGNMEILYSNILPLKTMPGQQVFLDRFNLAVEKADKVDIAVGYVSKSSVQELERIINDNKLENIELIIGMYYLEGMPEGTYNATLALNSKLKEGGRGIVKLVKTLKYHGKLYVFYKDGKPFEAFIGSHNLGAIKVEASNIRQYEISAVTTAESEINEITSFITQLKDDNCSIDISCATDIKIIREMNNALIGQEFVSKITNDEVNAYKSKITDVQFEIPLKVPENLLDTNMRGSNINVCYAKGRKRVWWETEIVVSKQIRDLPNYPEYQKPFMVITDDGWKFLAWTCGDNNKNLYSKDDLKIMGRWIKGRLVAAGLVEAVNNVETDIDGKGVITGEMLEQYGRNTITLTKTELTTSLEDGSDVQVWMLSFLPESNNRKEDEE
ncbi:restriction endonuclease PLD domain-containing protein [Lacrimispora sp. 38-1]|uniref:restriction endonuclease PLD domain-containing protein n=1 Tax=Lacrimispora sp. 38-1 TaxID=3125778 RepID=UPI003CE9EFF8